MSTQIFRPRREYHGWPSAVFSAWFWALDCIYRLVRIASQSLAGCQARSHRHPGFPRDSPYERIQPWNPKTTFQVDSWITSAGSAEVGTDVTYDYEPRRHILQRLRDILSQLLHRPATVRAVPLLSEMSVNLPPQVSGKSADERPSRN